MKEHTAEDTAQIMAEERRNHIVVLAPGQPRDPAIIFAQPSVAPAAGAMEGRPSVNFVNPAAHAAGAMEGRPSVNTVNFVNSAVPVTETAPSTPMPKQTTPIPPAKPLSKQAAYWARMNPAERTAEQMRRQAVKIARRNGQPIPESGRKRHLPRHPEAPPPPPSPCPSVPAGSQVPVAHPFAGTIAIIRAYRAGLQTDVQAIDRLLAHLNA